MATLQKPGKELYFEFNFPAAFKVLGKCIQLTLSNIFILSALIRWMGCIQLISFETQPGTSNCCRMGRKRERNCSYVATDRAQRRRRTTQLGDDPSCGTIRTFPITDSARWATRVCKSLLVYLCLWLCLCMCVSVEKNAFPESEPQKSNT